MTRPRQIQPLPFIHDELLLGNGWSPGCQTSACLLYLNSYHAGMSSLAVHALYTLLNGLQDLSCDRAFVESCHQSNTPLNGLASGLRLDDFDLVAVSTSFELDWLTLPTALQRGGIPPLRHDRTKRHPFVMGGGPCFTSNPAPVLDFFDAVYIGEIEPALPHLARLPQIPRGAWSEYLAEFPGFIVPGITAHPATRQCLMDIDAFHTDSAILTPHTAFANRYLIEMGRGCGRGCSFCLAGKIYRPTRYRRPDGLMRRIEHALHYTEKIGLVAASVSDYPWLNQLCDDLDAVGRPIEVSVSSLRIDGKNERMYELLTRSGQRSATFAPETGTETLRNTICKHLTDVQITHGIEAAVAAGLRAIKLYFLVGLPGETQQDRDAITEMVAELGAHFPECTWSISVNPVVPKPHTRFERIGVPDARTMRRIMKQLGAETSKLQRTEFHAGSARWAAVQAIISRGGSELTSAIMEASSAGADFGSVRNAFARAGYDVMGPIEPLTPEASIPWSIIDPSQS